MSSTGKRVIAVDVLRGLTISIMILVNDPGDRTRVYRQLDHSVWNGWTLTDLVFPSFMFLLGASLIFSFEGRLARGVAKSDLARKLATRSGLLLVIGWFLNMFPHFEWIRFRYFGVLPRIAVCSLLAGLILLATRRVRTLLLVVGIMIVGYWLLTRWVPVPGLGMPGRDFPLFDPDRNLGAWIDRGFMAWTQEWFHTGRLYEVTRDPEGILSTIPSVATVLLGAVAGIWLRTLSGLDAFRRLLSCGVAFLVAAELWNLSFPINKKLWTSSFVLLTAGISMVLLAMFYKLFDLERLQERSMVARRTIWPFLVYGSNAIVAYCVSELLSETLSWPKVNVDQHSVTFLTWFYAHTFALGGSTELTSFLFALSYVLVCFLPSWYLWNRKILVRL